MGAAEAVKAYELVIQKYAAQTEAVSEARSRLAALQRPEPKGLAMTRLNVALEEQTLSPDGTKMAGIRVTGEGQNVVVYDLATEKTENITTSTGEKSHAQPTRPSGLRTAGRSPSRPRVGGGLRPKTPAN
jgi:Tol biopolymer transport system component